MDNFASETDSDYTSYWRDWVSSFFVVLLLLFPFHHSRKRSHITLKRITPAACRASGVSAGRPALMFSEKSWNATIKMLWEKVCVTILAYTQRHGRPRVSHSVEPTTHEDDPTGAFDPLSLCLSFRQRASR